MSEAVTEHFPATITPSQYNFEAIPEELKALPRWVMWRHEPGKDGIPTKVPYSANTGRKASSNDPISWTIFSHAVNVWESGRYTGIGFELGNDDDIICIDLDDKKATGKMDEFITLSREFNSFTEISQSGNGIHIWCRGKKPGNSCKRGDFEIYERERFITVTGNQVSGSPNTLNNAQDAINRFYENVKPKENKQPARYVPDTPVELSDDEIIRIALKNSHGFDALWRGDFSRYSSQSEADAALTLLLSWYTKDEYQIDRIFRQSGLYREKWDREDYRIKTISSALQKQTGQYDPHFRRSVHSSFQPRPGTVQPVSWTSGSHPLTDLGNAERFFQQFCDDIRYCAPFKSWYIWTDDLWQKDSTLKRERFAIETVRAIYTEAGDMPDEKDRKRIADWAKASESQQRRSAMIQTVSSMVAINPDIWDAKPNLFNMQNGTYDLISHTFKGHQKDDFLTNLAGVKYQSGDACPVWEQHLNLIFNDDADLVSGFQELAGYTLLSGNPDEIFCICWGSGRNGKGKTFDAIAYVHGDYARNVAFKTFTIKKNGGESTNDIARLKGSRFVRASESEEGDRLSESLIKSLSGGDTITARLLYQENEEYLPEFIIFLQTNHKPIIRNWDQAIESRLWLIPFTKYIEQDNRDQNILKKLKLEGSGIFNWMLEGLKRYQKRGRLHKPTAVRVATEEYKHEQDRIGEFIAACCIKAPGMWAYRKDLYDAYRRDCLQNGVEELSQNIFSRLLQSHHGIREGQRKDKGRTWKGIALQTRPDTSDTSVETRLEKELLDRTLEKESLVDSPQEKGVLPVLNPDTTDSNDTSISKFISREELKKKLPAQLSEVTKCQNLSEWIAHHGAVGMQSPDRYQILKKPGSCRCMCKGCESIPIKAVGGMFPLCQTHFNEYHELWQNEHQEAGL